MWTAQPPGERRGLCPAFFVHFGLGSERASCIAVLLPLVAGRQQGFARVLGEDAARRPAEALQGVGDIVPRCWADSLLGLAERIEADLPKPTSLPTPPSALKWAVALFRIVPWRNSQIGRGYGEPRHIGSR
jgi:hypothetical protein